MAEGTQGTHQQRNVILLVTDEERYPPAYEASGPVAAFRSEHLPSRQKIAEKNGMVFHQHRVASCACTPSRASLFTGHYPTLHGATRTGWDPVTRWVRPDLVPTMGHYYKQAGYETYYVGKWHLTEENLRDEAGKEVMTNDRNGRQCPEGRQAYEKADVLRKFGFEDNPWIGPEPHGAWIGNAGVHRDPLFAQDAIALLRRLEQRRAEAAPGESPPPFLLVICLLNPHDICISTLMYETVGGMPTDDACVPVPPPPATLNEDVTKLPRAYQQAIEQVPKLLRNPRTAEDYYKSYLWFHKLVDVEMGKILTTLRQECPLVDAETITVFTSDHGDLAGAHGGGIQKWYNAFEEVVHVPLVLSGGGMPVTRNEVEHVRQAPTSHVDLLPTLLQLCNIDVNQVCEELLASQRFDCVPSFAGQSFAHIVSETKAGEEQEDKEAYFMSEDDIGLTPNLTGLVGLVVPWLSWFIPVQVDAVRGARHVESLVVVSGGSVWKVCRYWENTVHWTVPGVEDRIVAVEGRRAGQVTVRTLAEPDEWLVYNLTEDPAEMVNLHPPVGSAFGANDEELSVTIGMLKVRLAKAHCRYRQAPPAPHAPLPYKELIGNTKVAVPPARLLALGAAVAVFGYFSL